MSRARDRQEHAGHTYEDQMESGEYDAMEHDWKQMVKEDLELLAEAYGEELRAYSGRGMYGKQCASFSCADYLTVVESCAKRGIPRPQYDNLGRQYIVYWPDVEMT